MDPFTQWHRRSGAKVFELSSFLDFKRKHGMHIVGVMGFAGSWKRAPFKGQALKDWIESMKGILQSELVSLYQVHQEKMVMASGATNLGVLQLAYQICHELEITSMAIAPNQALNYQLAQFELAVPIGKLFGDESEAFVDICDSFILLGGGEQSRRETLAVHTLNKPLVVIQGFGGVADEFEQRTLSNARFIGSAGR